MLEPYSHSNIYYRDQNVIITKPQWPAISSMNKHSTDTVQSCNFGKSNTCKTQEKEKGHLQSKKLDSEKERFKKIEYKYL